MTPTPPAALTLSFPELPGELPELAGTELAEILARAQREVDGFWRAFGISGTAELATRSASGPLGGVAIGDEPLALSARRREQIISSALRSPATREELNTRDPLPEQRFLAASNSDRATLIAELVRARLIANLSLLVDRFGAHTPEVGPGDAERARAILVRAAQLGVGPGELDLSRLGECLAQSDLAVGCEGLISPLLGSRQILLRTSRAGLRTLTTSDGVGRSWYEATSFGASLDSLQSVRTSLWNAYGVNLPEVHFEIADEVPDECFQFTFGRLRTPYQRMLPIDTIAVPREPEFLADKGILPTSAVIGRVIDPFTGACWPVVSVSHRMLLIDHEIAYYDTAGMTMRALYAEAGAWLPMFSPERVPPETGEWFLRGELAQEMARQLPRVHRWLLASRAPVIHTAPVIEAVLRSLAAGEHDTETLVNNARQCLGGAVIGQLPLAGELRLLELDPATVRDALGAGKLSRLTARHPELLTTTESIVAVCPAADRSRLTELIRPLSDVVTVVSDTEIAGTVLRLPARVG